MKKHKRGIFIAVEGIDGAGCTTISSFIAKLLDSWGLKVCLTKEPTNGAIGYLIRKSLREDAFPPEIDALLFAADRLDHILQLVKPKLQAGWAVISDRYFESSMCYQGAQGVDQRWIEEINRFCLKPDLTIILDVEPEVARKRKKEFGSEKFEDVKFLEKVRLLYQLRAREKGYKMIDAGQPLSAVKEEVKGIIQTTLKGQSL